MATVHFASRAKLDDPNDGFHIVFSGIIVLQMDRMKLFEKEDWDIKGNKAQPTFVALFDSIKSIKCNFIRSHHGNFDSGKMTMVGSFDCPYLERIMLKMEILSYGSLVQALKESCLESDEE
jgi:hypothetical protein